MVEGRAEADNNKNQEASAWTRKLGRRLPGCALAGCFAGKVGDYYLVSFSGCDLLCCFAFSFPSEPARLRDVVVRRSVA